MKGTVLYPKPDRSNQTLNFTKSEENDAIDLGWNEGILSDGRPYRAECWAQYQVTMITVYLSSLGLENYSNLMLRELLSNEGLIKFLADDLKYIQAVPITDASGNEMWAVNVVIGTSDGLVAKDAIGFRKYNSNT